MQVNGVVNVLVQMEVHIGLEIIGIHVEVLLVSMVLLENVIGLKMMFGLKKASLA